MILGINYHQSFHKLHVWSWINSPRTKRPAKTLEAPERYHVFHSLLIFENARDLPDVDPLACFQLYFPVGIPGGLILRRVAFVDKCQQGAS